MDAILRLTSIMLPVLCASVVMLNWVYVWMDRANRNNAVARHVSTVPLVSMVLALFYAILPLPSIDKSWIWVLPLIDAGNWKWVAATRRSG
jgi:hypothetical protein